MYLFSELAATLVFDREFSIELQAETEMHAQVIETACTILKRNLETRLPSDPPTHD